MSDEFPEKLPTLVEVIDVAYAVRARRPTSYVRAAVLLSQFVLDRYDNPLKAANRPRDDSPSIPPETLPEVSQRAAAGLPPALVKMVDALSSIVPRHEYEKHVRVMFDEAMDSCGDAMRTPLTAMFGEKPIVWSNLSRNQLQHLAAICLSSVVRFAQVR